MSSNRTRRRRCSRQRLLLRSVQLLLRHEPCPVWTAGHARGVDGRLPAGQSDGEAQEMAPPVEEVVQQAQVGGVAHRHDLLRQGATEATVQHRATTAWPHWPRRVRLLHRYVSLASSVCLWFIILSLASSRVRANGSVFGLFTNRSVFSFFIGTDCSVVGFFIGTCQWFCCWHLHRYVSLDSSSVPANGSVVGFFTGTCRWILRSVFGLLFCHWLLHEYVPMVLSLVYSPIVLSLASSSVPIVPSLASSSVPANGSVVGIFTGTCRWILHRYLPMVPSLASSPVRVVGFFGLSLVYYSVVGFFTSTCQWFCLWFIHQSFSL